MFLKVIGIVENVIGIFNYFSITSRNFLLLSFAAVTASLCEQVAPTPAYTTSLQLFCVVFPLGLFIKVIRIVENVTGIFNYFSITSCNFLLLSVFRSRNRQLTTAGSYARLHCFPSIIVLCSLLHWVLFLAIRCSASRLALVFSHMSICFRSASVVWGRPVLGQPRYPLSPPVLKYADIAWFGAPPHPNLGCGQRGTIACPIYLCLFDGTDTVHTTTRCLFSVASESQ